MSPYTVLDHTADTGVEATGDDLPKLIRSLSTAMFELMASIDPCPSEGSVTMRVSAETEADLVFDALSELLYRSEVDYLLLCDIEVSSTGPCEVEITASGISWDSVELGGPPIKAVTYHDFTVEETDDGWFARVYFDV